MKKLLISITCTFITIFILNAQILPDSTATWTIATVGWGSYSQNTTYRILSDTSINEKEYKAIHVTYDSIFDLEQSEYYCAIREEDKMWFIIPSGETTDYLIYNFEANVEDTISINSPNQACLDELIVFEIDSIQLSDGYHKRLHVGIYDGPSGLPNVIDQGLQGIGSVNGLFYPGYYLADAGFQLLCYHEQESLLYINSPDNSCGFISVGLDHSYQLEDIQIFQNSIDNTLFMKTDREIIVEVFSILGSKLIVSTTKAIDLNMYPPGIYILNIYNDHNQLLLATKIIR